MVRSNKENGLLQGARVYLSGPMDFVASRAAEKKSGWRNRVGEFLEATGVTVFDPWFKPDVRGLYEYGREDAKSGERIKEVWTYRAGTQGGGDPFVVRAAVLGNAPHRPAHGGHERLHDFVLPDEHL